jgi:hypothetical protein
MIFNHVDARACGTYYAVVITENIYKVFGYTLRLVAVSGIKQGLPAAGLFRMIYGLFAQTRKQLVCSDAYLRQHDVHGTRDKQRNLHNILLNILMDCASTAVIAVKATATLSRG